MARKENPEKGKVDEASAAEATKDGASRESMSGENGDSNEEKSRETAGESETDRSDAPVVSAEKFDALNDKYLRLYAEFENFRRRTAKENVDLIATANAKLMGRMTEVLDNFDRAFDPNHKVEKLEDFHNGVRLIYQKFKEILEDEGLESIDPLGQEFNPELHEALMQQPHESIPENHVAQVFQKGYRVKSRIIKHAQVIVSTGRPQMDDSGKSGAKEEETKQG